MPTSQRFNFPYVPIIPAGGKRCYAICTIPHDFLGVGRVQEERIEWVPSLHIVYDDPKSVEAVSLIGQEMLAMHQQPVVIIEQGVDAATVSVQFQLSRPTILFVEKLFGAGRVNRIAVAEGSMFICAGAETTVMPSTAARFIEHCDRTGFFYCQIARNETSFVWRCRLTNLIVAQRS